MRLIDASKSTSGEPSLRPNFVSGQHSTCCLTAENSGGAKWCFVQHGDRIVTAGMPYGAASPEDAVSSLLSWCEENSLSPIIFGCEESDRAALTGWSLTEIGRQPLFEASPDFDPELSGQEQPSAHRELRRQARRALSKGLMVKELTVVDLWLLSQSGALSHMFHNRWKRRALADFSFLVEFDLTEGLGVRRAFAATHEETGEVMGLAMIVPCQRGWLLEHKMLGEGAPNGTGELLLCRLLSEHLPPNTRLSLGITPLYRELTGTTEDRSVPGILQFLPGWLRSRLLAAWEPLYGFRSLLEFREKLEPPRWESVYWAVPQRRPIRDIIAVLRAFAGGSFWQFATETLEKQIQLQAHRLRDKVLPAINWFYVVTLLLWIPILWNLDGEQLFGNPLACKVWALYDLLLLCCFYWQHKILKSKKPSYITDLLFGLVTADTVLAWLQTALYHGGLPTVQPLGTFLFMINTAPISAVFFQLMVKLSTKPLPFQRRDVT